MPKNKNLKIAVQTLTILNKKDRLPAKLLNKLKLLSPSRAKISKSSLLLKLESTSSTENQAYEWRKLVGSIRRRMTRHGTSTQAKTPPELTQTQEPIRRKSSLTHAKLDFLRREKSRDDPDCEQAKKASMTLSKQKSVGFDIGPESPKSGVRPKLESAAKSEPVNKIDKDKLFVKCGDKGVRKSDSVKTKDNIKVQKSSNFSFRSNICKSGSGKMKEEKNRDDFLKATMRIFLVVSPPVGKMQVIKKNASHQFFCLAFAFSLHILFAACRYLYYLFIYLISQVTQQTKVQLLFTKKNIYIIQDVQ